MSESLNIKLDLQDGSYEGPLDLLLHLIDRAKVDIDDIPISLITSQYLESLETLEGLSLDASADFLLMAATLANIKSRLLLPRLDEDGEPEEDPRLELTRPLMEYAKLKSVATALNERPLLDRDVFTRGEMEELSAITFDDNIQATLFELIEAWRQLADRKDLERKRGLKFLMETKTIGEKLGEIRAYLLEHKSSHFSQLAKVLAPNPLELALSFLGVLELARTGFLRLYQETETEFYGPGLWLADPEAKDLDPTELDYR
ncbi:MAG: segregation/condensation protein A [Deltaproteobacteria bacterium]|nr:segregation/condensation protein A [Deltaproteobacteria bacterium]